MDVYCPQCSAQFRVAEDSLDAKVKCTQCYRLFFPKTTVGKRPRQQDNTKIYIGFGVLAVLIVASFALMSSDSDRPAIVPDKTDEKRVPLGVENPRVQSIMSWAGKVAGGDTFGIEQSTDMGAVQKFLQVDPEKDYRNLTGPDRTELDRAIFAALATSEQTRYLRELRCTHGQLGDESMATSDEGKITLYLVPERGDKRYAEGQCRIEVAFRMDGETARVTSWQVERKPREYARVSKENYIPHDKIAKPTIKKGTFRGEEYDITESEPVALDHFEDTPAELRTEIDQLVDDVINIDGPGRLFNRATDRLRKIGRPAVPRLLNKMYELHGDVMGNNLQISSLDRCLRQLTGNAYNYPVSAIGKTPAELKEARISAVKQWYAWWYKYHAGEFDLLIDKRENLDDPPPGEEPKKPIKKS